MIGAHERAQRAFAAYVREPLGQPLPEGIEPRRMKIYAELVYNAFEGFVAGGFPRRSSCRSARSSSPSCRQARRNDTHCPALRWSSRTTSGWSSRWMCRSRKWMRPASIAPARSNRASRY